MLERERGKETGGLATRKEKYNTFDRQLLVEWKKTATLGDSPREEERKFAHLKSSVKG